MAIQSRMQSCFVGENLLFSLQRNGGHVAAPNQTLHIYLFIYLFVCLFVCCLLVCLFVFLLVYLFITIHGIKTKKKRKLKISDSSWRHAKEALTQYEASHHKIKAKITYRNRINLIS